MSIRVMTQVWDTSEQKGSALLLLLALADHAADDGFCWPGLERLAKKIRMSTRSVSRLLQKLEDDKDLYAIRRNGEHNWYVVRVGMTDQDVNAVLKKRHFDTLDILSPVTPVSLGEDIATPEPMTQQCPPNLHEPSLNRQEEPPLADSPLLERINELGDSAREQLEDYIITLEEPRDERADSPVEDSPSPEMKEFARKHAGVNLPDDGWSDGGADSPPVEDSLTPDTGLHDTNQERLQRIQQCADPDGAMEQYEEKPTVDERIVDDSEETAALFKPPEPSPHEPVEQGKARRRHELGTTPLGVAAAVTQNRAAVEHPDMADPHRDFDAWWKDATRAFCAVAHVDYETLKPSYVIDWPRQIKKWADGWEDAAPTSDETVQCLKGITQSEHAWKTFTSPRQPSFQETMDVMLSRLRGGQPWNAEGKKANGSTGGRGAQVEGNGFRAMPAAKTAR